MHTFLMLKKVALSVEVISRWFYWGRYRNEAASNLVCWGKVIFLLSQDSWTLVTLDHKVVLFFHLVLDMRRGATSLSSILLVGNPKMLMWKKCAMWLVKMRVLSWGTSGRGGSVVSCAPLPLPLPPHNCWSLVHFGDTLQICCSLLYRREQSPFTSMLLVKRRGFLIWGVWWWTLMWLNGSELIISDFYVVYREEAA